MVERTNELDGVFRALGDPTRRDMLTRLSKRGMSIGHIAEYYELTFAAVAKHVDVLARAGLVVKARQGKEQVATLDPKAFAAANAYLEQYQKLWQNRLDSLDNFLKNNK